MLESNINYSEETEGVEVSVTPIYVEEKSAPENDYYFFAYKVKIKNLSESPLQLMNRHWIIRDGKKKQRYVNGEGVVGQRPILAMEEEFIYTSFCPLSTPTGNMRGKFEIKNLEHGHNFWVPIPLFFFRTDCSSQKLTH